ncbi:dihydrodipicolinate synthase family protein [Edaphobacter sp.]|uniref:dihydrodipicolinate synthase family protein n=1 Tax=Edaphobacter sp. TaxID=1934404 RepID=UPI002DB57637|nr:dihydrodipicolinate synthase family protein [Edaphobacter sp.]HEU5341351.1 dihydrodipicolinate synthase family protein [Edaphobacter sp.]
MVLSSPTWRERFRAGTVIPAHPLALTEQRKLDERHQRALTRYYLAAGAGGVAVGVHTTQFEIRDPRIGLYEPVLALAAEELRASDAIRVAGVCGNTAQAAREAQIARDLKYHAALLNLVALADSSIAEVVAHVRAIGEIMPIIGFYLQPAVGGQYFPVEFWRAFAEIESVIGIKIAPFNRYATQDVLRGVAESGRSHEIALYTGNDDHIVLDLLSGYHFSGCDLQIRGGLLGHWSVWTSCAVELHRQVRQAVESGKLVDPKWLLRNAEVTDMNAALFDVGHHFHGCIAGINEVLRRQGLLAGRWCLNPAEDLSGGQAQELDRVIATYPHLVDDQFVKQNLDTWLS